MPDVPLLRRQLLKWFDKNRRNHYPWRHTKNPYHILIAETFLQRTKADQVLPVYKKFIQEIASVSDLAAANEARIQRIIYPLGLAWRGKNLRQTAIDVIERFGGHIPPKREDLLQIKGIGEYIADSIRYVGFGIRSSIIDSNIIRILGRIYGIPTTPESRRDKKFRELADSLIPRKKFREFNLALLDHGALICVRNPKCDICPIKNHCNYYMRKTGAEK
jgi:A/G-specific adenine glycosylase